MSPELQAGNKNLYATDYVRWVDMTVQQLRAKNYAAVDWDNLIEEIEDMSRRERKSLKSNLIVILLHLLKWQYQPDRRSGSWRGSKNSFKLHDIPWRSCVSSIDPKGQSLRHITLFATLPKLRSGVLPQKKLETSNWTCLIKKQNPLSS